MSLSHHRQNRLHLIEAGPGWVALERELTALGSA
jgi:hypothetical protein